MRSLLNFLLRFKTLILFLILEAVALVMITSSHNYHQTVAYGISRSVTGFISSELEDGLDYFRLRKINEQLESENLELRQLLEKAYRDTIPAWKERSDTVLRVSYTYMQARVINNSVNKQKNFLTLNRGTRNGVARGMGVVSADGIVGVIVGVSDNFSVAMSMLNTDFRLSASIARNNYFGSLAWDGKNYLYAQLSEIPHHVAINQGDTIVTSGFSAIFPPGIMIGTLTGDIKKGGDFITLKVLLATDFKQLVNVYLIGNYLRDEREGLEMEVSGE